MSCKAVTEELRLLCCLLVHNLWWIDMSLGGRREQEVGESEVEGSGEVEELEEQVEGTCKNEDITNNNECLGALKKKITE